LPDSWASAEPPYDGSSVQWSHSRKREEAKSACDRLILIHLR
jgi:hypothetical protein